MKQYQVTKKLQVTIPKRLAERAGIVPGDAVVFDEAGGEITLRRAGRPKRTEDDLEAAVAEFTADLSRITPRIREAGRALNENLSGHVGPE